MEIEASTEIGVDSARIYSFLLGLTKEKYLKWHVEHRDFKAIKRTKDLLGSEFFFDEVISGHTLNFVWTLVKVIPNRRIELKAKFILPICLIFKLEEGKDRHTKVTQIVKVGYSNRMQTYLDPFIRMLLTQKTVKALGKHFTEEFKNIEIYQKELLQ